MKRSFTALLALCLATLLLGGSLAGAQEQEADADELQYLSIQAVDARDEGSIDLIVGFTGPVSALERAVIEENGNGVRPSSVEPIAGSDTLMVLAVDTSESMLAGDALTRAKRALEDLVENRPQGQRVGIVALGGGARVVQAPTTDTERLVTAIDGLAYSGPSTSTTSGIDAAARMIGDRNDELAHLVMIIGGANTGGVTGAQARGRMTSAGAKGWIIALDGRGAGQDEGFLRSVVSTSGGQYFPTANLDAMVRNLEDVGERIQSQYVVSYPSAATGPVDLTLEAGAQSTSVSFVTGSRIAGATALRPAEAAQPGGVGFLRDNGQVIGLLAAVLAAVLAVYAIGSLVAPDRSSLDSALEVYTESPTSSTFDDDEESSGMATTALIQRAVGYTEQFAESQGFLAKVEATLERADLPLRAAEAMFFYAASAVLLAVLSFALTGGNILGTIAVTVIIAFLPLAVVQFLARRRQKKFEGLLPDTLNLLAGTLRAGYSLMQGVEAVSREVAEPMGKELRRVVTEARLGRPLEESLEASAERMDSGDFAWAVMAIRIQREVGGNLAELLVTVADTMTQRERLRRDVSALTAEGRVSAMVLGALPVGLGAFLYMGNPDYIGVLFEETMGQVMLVGAVVLALVGFVWMKKVISVDI